MLLNPFVLGAGSGPGIDTDIDAYTTGLWAAYSVRKVLSGYSGNALEVRNVSGGALANIGWSGAGIDAAALATHLGSNNGTARTWYNQQGTSGRDLQQATSGLQPACATAGAFDGKIAFDGTDDIMPTVGNSGTPAAFTIILRGKLRATTTQVLLEHSTAYISNDAVAVYYDAGALVVGVHDNSPGGFAVSQFSGAAPNDNVQAWRFDRSQGTSADMARLFVNGVGQTRTGNIDSGTLPDGNFGAHAWYLGAKSDATIPAALDVHTLLIYETALSDGDVAAISAIVAGLP